MPNETAHGENAEGSYWLSVIGRSLAYVCLHTAELQDADVATQATFLMALGLDRKDVASIIGTTEETVRVTLHKVKKSGGRKFAKRK